MRFESELRVTIVAADYHRNGVGGAGFYAILFDDAEEGRMIATIFREQENCAVYKVEELAKGNIAFARGNSWRGDRYRYALWPLLVAKVKAEHGYEPFD